MEIDAERVRRLSTAHAAAYLEIADRCAAPGRAELLASLTDAGVPWRSRRAFASRRRVSTARSASIPTHTRSSPATSSPTPSPTKIFFSPPDG